MHIQISKPSAINPACDNAIARTSRRVIGRLQLNDKTGDERLVFGFDHDGERTFYQVANNALQQDGAELHNNIAADPARRADPGCDLIWIEHVEPMSYRAYDYSSYTTSLAATRAIRLIKRANYQWLIHG